MKKIYILLCLIFSLTFILPVFGGCGGETQGENPDDNEERPASMSGYDLERLFYQVTRDEAMKIPEFYTNLTNEEHLNNIQKLAEKEYPSAGRIYVDLLYNYKDEPQFFLVEFDYSAIVGIIIDDKYYLKDEAGMVRDYYHQSKTGYYSADSRHYDPSPLAEVDAFDCKKYYLTFFEDVGGEVYFERDGMMHHFVANKKYIFCSEEDYIVMSSLNKEQFLEWAEENYSASILWATGRNSDKGQTVILDKSGNPGIIVNGESYGYAKDINDLKQLGV